MIGNQSGGYAEVRSPLLPIVILTGSLNNNPNNITSLLSMQSSSSSSSGSSHQLPPELQEKILYGERRPPNSNRIVGAHSPKIKTDPDFTVQVLNNNSDGTTFVESIKKFPDGTFSRPKKSTAGNIESSYPTGGNPITF